MLFRSALEYCGFFIEQVPTIRTLEFESHPNDQNTLDSYRMAKHFYLLPPFTEGGFWIFGLLANKDRTRDLRQSINDLTTMR